MTGDELPDLTGPGTAAELWQHWHGLAELPELTLRPKYAPADVVLVAPHPDDEVLGAGGALALLGREGARITIIAVTDGEGSHPDSPTVSPGALAERRVAERAAAFRALGLSDVDVQRLHLPDGGVAGHEPELSSRLRERLHADSLCFAPFAHDGHPDHDAAGRAAVVASTATGARLHGYLIWLWHWAWPGDVRVPWQRMERLPLPPDVRAAKRRAAAAFTSQLHPLSGDPADAAVLPPAVLRRLLRDDEVYVG